MNLKQKNPITLAHDPVHFKRNIRKKIVALQLSGTAFGITTKKLKSKRQRRFANDLCNRTEAEFTVALKKASLKNSKQAREKHLNKILEKNPESILECITDECGETCKLHSFVCNGKNNFKEKHSTLTTKTNFTSSDRNKILTIIKARLGP